MDEKVIFLFQPIQENLYVEINIQHREAEESNRGVHFMLVYIY